MTATTPESAPAASAETPPPEKCRAVKRGVVDLPCSLPRDHDQPEGDEPGTWHESAFTDRREIAYDGARHSIVTTETVTWEPVDHAAEAARLLMAGLEQEPIMSDGLDREGFAGVPYSRQNFAGDPAAALRDYLTQPGYAEWRRWLDAQGCHFDDDSHMAEAFTAGMQAARDLDRQLLARVRADLAWIWRETTDERARERANEALTALSEAGVEAVEALGAESAREALDAQSLHDSPGSEL